MMNMMKMTKTNKPEHDEIMRTIYIKGMIKWWMWCKKWKYEHDDNAANDENDNTDDNVENE